MFQLLLAIIYVSFISLGLPDGLLGAAWPTIYPEFGVPVSYAGIIFMIISAGTIVSSLQSDRLTKRFGTGMVTAVSVLTTAVALWGFSVSNSYLLLMIWAIPYGLGAGSVDASINNYVALHYKSHHMSWLHCMWGVGASTGPYVMSYALAAEKGWHMGYRYICFIQIVLTAILFISLPLWKGRTGVKQKVIKDSSNVASKDASKDISKEKPLTLKEIFHICGVKQVMLMFFCYCALEQTAGLWASSYMVLRYNVDIEAAAGYGSMFFVGLTIARGVCGFITMKLNDNQMIRLGQVLIGVGILLMFLPFGENVALVGLLVIGFGCAPIYPCIIHSTPANFGADKSQAIVGVQMASAYTGNLLMPPLFGLIANHISVGLFPMYMLLILCVMWVMHVQLQKRVREEA